MKVAIIDDESGVRNTICSMIHSNKTLNRICKITGEADGIKTGLALLNATPIDVLLLDIQMQDGIAFDLLKGLDNVSFQVIFITAYDEYAIKAIKFNALDYLLKPVDPSELYHALLKANETILNQQSNQQVDYLLEYLAHPESSQERIVIKTSESIHLVELSSIVRCEANVNYTNFYFANRDKLVVSKTLKEYEDILSHKGFFRSHKSHLINLRYIEKFDRRNGGLLIMNDRTEIPISLNKKEDLLDALNNVNRALNN